MRYLDTAIENSPRLSEWLTGQLADADFVAMRTGFTSARGVNLVLSHLNAVLSRGGRIEMVVGGTDEQPDPAALLLLEGLARDYPDHASFRIVTDPDVFQNAKTYYVQGADGTTTAWVGSANLTYGGLATNHEAVVILEADDPKHLKTGVLEGIQAYADGNGAEPLTVEAIRRLEVQKAVTRGGWRSSVPPLGVTRTLEELMLGTLDGLDATASLAGQPIGVPTGFADLDAVTSGLHPGQLIVIAGRPAVGASTLLTDFARACSVKHGLPSAIFSMQCRYEDLMQRILSAEAKIRLGDMRSGTMSNEDWTRLGRRSSELADAPLLLNCGPAAHIDALYNGVVDLASSKQLRAVFIDSLNSIRATVEANASREREISAVARQLKVLALQLQIPVVVTAELGRGVDGRFDKVPTLADLRESDVIGQVADVVVLLNRPDLYERDHPRAGEADLLLAKHRNGPPCTVLVAHQLHYCRFADLQG